MRPTSVPILAALLPAALLLTPAPAEARPRPREPQYRAAPDMEATLARMAERDRLRGGEPGPPDQLAGRVRLGSQLGPDDVGI